MLKVMKPHEWNQNIIDGAVDVFMQTQTGGFDLTLNQIHRFIGPGVVDFDNTERRVSETEIMEFGYDDSIFLEPGTYKVVFNEVVKIPLDATGFCFPRSTLLRSGVSSVGAVWDSGFVGIGESLLTVGNKNGFIVKRNARIMQLVLIKNDTVVDEKDAYRGVYAQRRGL